jgi:hypothetical protein
VIPIYAWIGAINSILYDVAIIKATKIEIIS